MAEEEKKKKGFLDSIIDTFSSRDEKEAEEKAQKEAEEAKLKAMADKAAADKAAAQKKAEAQKRAEAQKKAAAEAEKQAAAEEAKQRQLVEAQKAAEREKEAKAKELERQEQIAARKAEAAQPKIITVHELTSDETLSHLSLKYYGHATKPYWMVIYEANIDVVGDNPNLVHRGMMIKIPELPPELQEKE